MTATDLENKTGMYKGHVSRALSELKNKGLVECKNPKDRAFRYYKITIGGLKVLGYF